jgi:hypothetical protein
MTLVLPYWPRLYSRLANDHDRRVREATQKAHLISMPSFIIYVTNDPHYPMN